MHWALIYVLTLIIFRWKILDWIAPFCDLWSRTVTTSWHTTLQQTTSLHWHSRPTDSRPLRSKRNPRLIHSSFLPACFVDMTFQQTTFNHLRDYETVKIEQEVPNEFLLVLDDGDTRSNVSNSGVERTKAAYYKNIERKMTLKKRRTNVSLPWLTSCSDVYATT